MFTKSLGIAGLGGIIAASLIQGASGGSPLLVESQARYVPIQSISYEFGSKFMTGYFVEQGATCIVTLMIIEKSDPEEPLGLSPMRVRLVLSPGQVAGLDSEEGRSLNFTCEKNAMTLLVDVGERDRLVALQDTAVREHIASDISKSTDDLE
jgi:hypothetical protein